MEEIVGFMIRAMGVAFLFISLGLAALGFIAVSGIPVPLPDIVLRLPPSLALLVLDFFSFLSLITGFKLVIEAESFYY